MIKLLAVSVFIAVGAITGVLFHKLTAKLSITNCLLLGVAGAFAGIWIADIADVHMIGNVIDNIIFAACGSTLLLSLNAIIRSRR